MLHSSKPSSQAEFSITASLLAQLVVVHILCIYIYINLRTYIKINRQLCMIGKQLTSNISLGG